MTEDDFFTPDNYPKKPVQIRDVQIVEVDGKPRLALFFFGEKKGLLVSREDYETMTKVHGHSPIADKFFKELN